MNLRLLYSALLLMPALLQADPLRLPDFGTSTPIFFRVKGPEGSSVEFNMKEYTKAQAEEWLQQTEKKFGHEDPVILLFSDEVPISVILEWNVIVRKTHPKVWSLVHTGQPHDAFSLLAMESIEDPRIFETLIRQFKADTVMQKSGKSIARPPLPPVGPLVPPPRLPTGPPQQYKGTDMVIPPPQELIDEIRNTD